MKAEISRFGFLRIKAENEIEIYALEKWIKDNVKSSEKGFHLPAGQNTLEIETEPGNITKI